MAWVARFCKIIAFPLCSVRRRREKRFAQRRRERRDFVRAETRRDGETKRENWRLCRLLLFFLCDLCASARIFFFFAPPREPYSCPCSKPPPLAGSPSKLWGKPVGRKNHRHRRGHDLDPHDAVPRRRPPAGQRAARVPAALSRARPRRA